MKYESYDFNINCSLRRHMVYVYAYKNTYIYTYSVYIWKVSLGFGSKSMKVTD